MSESKFERGLEQLKLDARVILDSVLDAMDLASRASSCYREGYFLSGSHRYDLQEIGGVIVVGARKPAQGWQWPSKRFLATLSVTD